MYIYVYTNISTCMYKFIFNDFIPASIPHHPIKDICIHMHNISINTCLYVYIYVHVYINTHEHVYMYTNILKYMYVCKYQYIYIDVCMFNDLIYLHLPPPCQGYMYIYALINV
jgi:hypothetical protein